MNNNGAYYTKYTTKGRRKHETREMSVEAYERVAFFMVCDVIVPLEVLRALPLKVA
jgi:hypothetical protein